MNFIKNRKWQKRTIVFFHDVIAASIAWLLAYWLRFNLSFAPIDLMKQAFLLLPVLLIIQAFSYIYFGLYRGIWRFTSVPDLIRIIKAVCAGSLAMLIATYFLTAAHSIPRSIFLIYSLLLISILGGTRLFYRWLKNHLHDFSNAKRVLIIGAGQAGEGLVRDMLRDVTKKYLPIAVIDDDERKFGLEIHGVRVLGTIKNIVEIAKDYQIELIMIALPSASSATMREIVHLCESIRIPFCTLPGLKDLAAGKVSINALREVSIEDLLGREAVTLDWQAINMHLAQKTVLVSGGGGSIGSELCRQIAKLAPTKLIILENNEFNLYSLEMEFKNKFPTIEVMACLVDVSDQIAVRTIFATEKPEVVFHAAAYKHVPMLESQLRIAVRNNILGTWILAQEAVLHGTKHFTLISTDKAVNPANIMGASKRAAEIICQNYNAHANTEFITVRFGNVLGSAGSVVPLFKKQIAEGGPVTVTHPEITRFFMTIPEASQLILQATAMGNGGEIFVLDMGEPIKITYLATQMIELAGLKINEDIQLKYTGLRPGEKLYEELFHESECLTNTKHEKIMQAQSRPWDWEILKNIIQQMVQACQENDAATLHNLLKNLVPEWQNTDAMTEPSSRSRNSSISAEALH